MRFTSLRRGTTSLKQVIRQRSVRQTEPPVTSGRGKQQLVTAILIVAPILGVVAAALGVISPRITLLDLILAVALLRRKWSRGDRRLPSHAYSPLL